MDQSEYIKKVEEENERLDERVVDLEKTIEELGYDVDLFVYLLSIFFNRDFNEYWDNTNTPKKTRKGKREYRQLAELTHKDLKEKQSAVMNEDSTDMLQEFIDNLPELRDALNRRMARDYNDGNRRNWLNRAP